MKNPAAVALGRIKSAAKSKAARDNGKLGGRPRKPKRVARWANDLQMSHPVTTAHAKKETNAHNGDGQ